MHTSSVVLVCIGLLFLLAFTRTGDNPRNSTLVTPTQGDLVALYQKSQLQTYALANDGITTFV